MTSNSTRRLVRWLLPFLLALLAGTVWADPPGRVARIAYVNGAASFAPAGERDWSRAGVNRPMSIGDKLWVDRGARAELQLGTAAVRVGSLTSVGILNLDDRVTQLELTQGVINVRVRRLDRGEVFEVATPNLAFSIRRPGSYRVEVDARGDSTAVLVRQGQAQAYGEGRAFVIAERRGFRFYDTGLRDYETFVMRAPDEFDRFAADRDRRWDNSPSRRYVSTEVIGYDDLDQYGTWRRVPDYGMVWVPSRVAADWAPYRDGHWSWVEPWGWTWIDDAPWGFAPSHYGRWARIGTTWGWVPGPATARPVYAPALVAFVGSGSPQSGGSVAWFPLGPREVYRPAYQASREYFYSVNASNTAVDRASVERYYTRREEPQRYQNQQVAGAVIGMLASAFAQSRPVTHEAGRFTPEQMQKAPVINVPPVVPQRAAVLGQAPTQSKPPEQVQSRGVVAQVAPPPPKASFEARQSALNANAGKPLDAAAAAAIKPTTPPAAPPVKVVQPTEPVTAPASAPVRAASGGSSRPAPAAPMAPPAPAAATPPPPPARAASTPAAPPPAAAPAPATAPPAAAAPASRERPASPFPPRERPASAPAASSTPPAPPAAVAPPAPPTRPAPAPAAAPAQPAPPAAAAPASERGSRFGGMNRDPNEARGRDQQRTREERPAAQPPAAQPAPATPTPSPAPAARPQPAPVTPPAPPAARPQPAPPPPPPAPAAVARPQPAPPAPAAAPEAQRTQRPAAQGRAPDASEPASGARGEGRFRRGEKP